MIDLAPHLDELSPTCCSLCGWPLVDVFDYSDYSRERDPARPCLCVGCSIGLTLDDESEDR
jgi:hypothetical protein